MTPIWLFMILWPRDQAQEIIEKGLSISGSLFNEHSGPLLDELYHQFKTASLQPWFDF